MDEGELIFFHAKQGHGQLPVYIATEDKKDIFHFSRENKKQINYLIHKYGGILLRNFTIRALSEFQKLSAMLVDELLSYENRSTPRHLLGGNIYTATEYPADKIIPLHSENAYTNKWPEKILFFCVIAPQEGGETPIADNRQIYKKIDPQFVKKCNEKKIMYVRNYTPGIDVSWQEVFQTQDKAVVEKYCQDNNIQYEWIHDPRTQVVFRTKQICQATLMHPQTHELVWFNQAHLFHHSALEKNDSDILQSMIDKEDFPRHTLYGDGSEIEDKDLTYIRDVMHSERIEFTWKKGDVLILDNILMAHARNAFHGERKIVVCMGK
jgi:alpha-ketoglutarate-dependent taurine dioxygenase